jgi:selenophosphate synthase
VAEALASCRPGPEETFDPTRHLARVTDVSGEGIGAIGRLVAREGRSLRLDRLPVLPAVADAAADRWAIPDATVETNGPFAAIGTPDALARAVDRLRNVEGADPVRLGRIDRGEAPIRDATDGDPSRLVEAAARWPTAGERQ